MTYFVSHLIAQYTFEIKKLAYNKFMSEETKKNDILHDMFTWSETYNK